MNSPRLRGQISEPTSGDEWRANFADVNELLRQLVERVTAAPGLPAAPEDLKVEPTPTRSKKT